MGGGNFSNWLFAAALLLISFVSFYIGFITLRKKVVVIQTDVLLFYGILILLLFIIAFIDSLIKATQVPDNGKTILFSFSLVFSTMLLIVFVKNLGNFLTILNVSQKEIVYSTIAESLEEKGIEFRRTREKILSLDSRQKITVFYNNLSKTANLKIIADKSLKKKILDKFKRIEGRVCDQINVIGSILTIATCVLIWAMLLAFILIEFS